MKHTVHSSRQGALLWGIWLLPSLALAAGPKSPAPAAAPAPAATAPAAAPQAEGEELAKPEDIRQLCLATRPLVRVYFSGDAVERSKDKAAYVTARKTAMQKLYRIAVPANGFRLGDYRPKDGTIKVDLSRAPRAMHGVVTLAMPEDLVTMTVTPEQAKAAASAVKAGTATLITEFELSEETGAPCFGSTATDVFTINANAVVFDLRDGLGNRLARTETARADRFRSLLGGYSGRPVAVIGAADGDGVNAISLNGRLSGAREPLQKCYVDRLKDHPDAGGTVVLGVSVQPDGAVEKVAFIADGTRGDDVLRKCIETAVTAVRFAGVAEKAGGFLFQVPIELKLIQSHQGD